MTLSSDAGEAAGEDTSRDPGGAAASQSAGPAGGNLGPDSELRIHELLASRTEAKRLERAATLLSKVDLQIDGPELYVAAVSSYNVVIDVAARRIQHGCRDFLGEARSGRLCKHVAGLLLHLDAAAALRILEGLADPEGDWHLEVITSRGFFRR